MKKKKLRGEGGSGGEEEGRLSSYVETIPCVQDSNDKSNQRTKRMVEKRRATRIRVYLWSWTGFCMGGTDTGVLGATTGRAQRLVGRRASFDHASLYLRCSPEVKVLWVDAFIVPDFSLMGNVHRKNMQTQKIIDSQEKK